MLDLTTIVLPKIRRAFCSVTVLALMLAFGGWNFSALAHPGTGIAVDQHGRVYFTDTGQGVWKIDESGRVSPHEGPAFHWLAIDQTNRFDDVPRSAFFEPSAQIQKVGRNPTLLLASDFPVTIDREGALYYPEFDADKRLRIYRLPSSGERAVLATVPAAADGTRLEWVNGIAAGPDGAIYFSENAAVRRISPQGTITTIASDVVVADCVRIPGASAALGPALRGLDIAPDRTVYVAASACGALLKITPDGKVMPVLRTTSPWSPTGVAVSGDSIFLLEYLHTTSDARREWIPRVRRISADGSSEIIALIERAGASESRPVHLNATSKSSFLGHREGAEKDVAGVRLCWCPPGTFRMGSPVDEPERRPGEAQVDVTLTRGFWMAKFEATQGQWQRVMGKLPGPLTAQLPEGDDFPVGNVNFAEAELFCRKLSELGWQSGELPKDWEFRLPTEAQWEYACRAGSSTATAFGNKLSSRQANFSGKPYNGAEPGPSLHRATKVGCYPANAWGLHDMHGNTFEWCRDWYHPTLPGGTDPDLYFDQASSRVRRGGCWADDGWPCRSAFRLRFEPERRYDHIGFRPVAVQVFRAK
jgi:formylglycine-generating enzyme